MSFSSPERDQQRKAMEEIALFMGENWEIRFHQQLKIMFTYCFTKQWHIQTPEEAQKAAYDILDRVPDHERTMVEPHLRHMSQDGQNVVILGNFDTPEGHAFFHFVGARMQNVGSAFLFSLPLDRFLRMRMATSEEKKMDSVDELSEARQDCAKLVREGFSPKNLQ